MDQTADGEPSNAVRLRTLEHISAITELKYRYWRACDAKDAVQMRACFVDGPAVIEYGPIGSFDNADALVAVYSSIALRTLSDGSYAVLDMHHGLHPVIAIHDATDDAGLTRATGRWTLQFRQIDVAQHAERFTCGEYEDKYLMQDGAWKISATRFLPQWALSRPLGDASVTQ